MNIRKVHSKNSENLSDCSFRLLGGIADEILGTSGRVTVSNLSSFHATRAKISYHSSIELVLQKANLVALVTDLFSLKWDEDLWRVVSRHDAIFPSEFLLGPAIGSQLQKGTFHIALNLRTQRAIMSLFYRRNEPYNWEQILNDSFRGCSQLPDELERLTLKRLEDIRFHLDIVQRFDYQLPKYRRLLVFSIVLVKIKARTEISLVAS